MSVVPVALFAYRRADHLEQVLESLARNEVSLLYAFSDAPACAEHSREVDEVRRLLKKIGWCRVELVERPANLGLGRSIRSGVSDVLLRHESVIVFEDDLVAVPGLYRYLTSALAHYRHDARVMSVTGWTHPRVTPADVREQPYFDGKAECWTWGTWRRGWHGMTATAVELMRDCGAAGIDPERFGSDLPKMAREEGSKNLWAVRWWFLHLSRKGLCMRPPHSLVEHLGFDSRATTSTGATRWANPPLRECPPVPARWPVPVEHPDCARLWRAAVGDV